MDIPFQNPVYSTFSKIKREYLPSKQFAPSNTFLYKRKSRMPLNGETPKTLANHNLNGFHYVKTTPKPTQKKSFKIVNKSSFIPKFSERTYKSTVSINKEVPDLKTHSSKLYSKKSFIKPKVDEYKFNSALNNKMNDPHKPSNSVIKKTKISLSNYKVRKGSSIKKSITPQTKSQTNISKFNTGQTDSNNNCKNLNLSLQSKSYIRSKPQLYNKNVEPKKNSHLELKFLLRPNNNYKSFSFINSEIESSECSSINESRPSVFNLSTINSLKQPGMVSNQDIFQKKYINTAQSLNYISNEVLSISKKDSKIQNNFDPQFQSNQIFQKKIDPLEIKPNLNNLEDINDVFPIQSAQNIQTVPNFNKNNILASSNVTPKSTTKRIVLKNFNFNSPIANNSSNIQIRKRLSKNLKNTKSAITLNPIKSNLTAHKISNFNEYDFKPEKLISKNNSSIQMTNEIPIIVPKPNHTNDPSIPIKTKPIIYKSKNQFQINCNSNNVSNLNPEKLNQTNFLLNETKLNEFVKDKNEPKEKKIEINSNLPKINQLEQIEKKIFNNNKLFSPKNKIIHKRSRSEIPSRLNRFEGLPSLQDIKTKKPGRSILRKSKSKQ